MVFKNGLPALSDETEKRPRMVCNKSWELIFMRSNSRPGNRRARFSATSSVLNASPVFITSRMPESRVSFSSKLIVSPLAGRKFKLSITSTATDSSRLTVSRLPHGIKANGGIGGRIKYRCKILWQYNHPLPMPESAPAYAPPSKKQKTHANRYHRSTPAGGGLPIQ